MARCAVVLRNQYVESAASVWREEDGGRLGIVLLGRNRTGDGCHECSSRGGCIQRAAKGAGSTVARATRGKSDSPVNTAPTQLASEGSMRRLSHVEH
jgi:hypothetical protein